MDTVAILSLIATCHIYRQAGLFISRPANSLFYFDLNKYHMCFIINFKPHKCKDCVKASSSIYCKQA